MREQVDVFTAIAFYALFPVVLIGVIGSFALFPTSLLLVLSTTFLLSVGTVVLVPPWWAWKPPTEHTRGVGRRRFPVKTAEGQQESPDFIVIGSGIAGLTTAAVLVSLGYTVMVLEAHEIAGGSTHEYHVDGNPRYTFPSGLHYVIPHCQHVLQATVGSARPPVRFERLGRSSDGMYERIRLTRTKGDDDLLIRDEKQLRTELHRRFPHLSEPLARYERLATQVLTASPLWMAAHALSWKIRRPLLSLCLPSVWWDYAGRSAQDVLVNDIFRDYADEEGVDELVSYLTALWVDTGCPPSRASFFMSVAVTLGFPHEGGVYPVYVRLGGGSVLLARLCPDSDLICLPSEGEDLKPWPRHWWNESKTAKLLAGFSHDAQ